MPPVSKLDRKLRAIIPSTAVLSQSAVFSAGCKVLDLLVRPYFGLFTKQPLPPLRFIVRTGVGNSLLFPHYSYLTASRDIWLYFFAKGYATLHSTIVDIGSGVGKSAVALRDFSYGNQRFDGFYHGFDVDGEMVDWCGNHFPRDHFAFTELDMFNTVYNRNGLTQRPALSCPGDSVDLVFSQSLFSHLLENDIEHYIKESFRVLKSGGIMLMTFFCLDDLVDLQLLGGRWTFQHQRGQAYLENIKYPESAVAYRREWMLQTARSGGFKSPEVILPNFQSTLMGVK